MENKNKMSCEKLIKKYLSADENGREEIIENITGSFPELIISALEKTLIDYDNGIQNNGIKKYLSNKDIEESYLINHGSTSEKVKYFKYLIKLMPENIFIAEQTYNNFQLTSQETDFQNYSDKIVIFDRRAGTEPIIFDNSHKTPKGKIKTKGEISCSLSSPLDWLNKEYKLTTNSNSITKTELIGKIKATKHFEFTADEINIYNAIVYLIKMKQYEDKIFISFNELHKQLGYKGKIRKSHKDKYKKVIDKFSYIRIFIDLSEAKQANYKKYYEIESNIEEPLLIFVKYKRQKVRFNNTVRQVDGFFSNKTDLMTLHFDFTNRFFTSKKPDKPKRVNKQNAKLNNYINKNYYLQKKNKDQTFTQYRLIETIFQDVLKEFNIYAKYLKAIENRNKSRFLKRNVFDILENNKFVKKFEIKNINEIEILVIYWES
jgi:hypothetical protein